MANDFSGDSNVISLYRFESGVITADSKGTDTLSTSTTPPIVDSGQVKEGADSAIFTASFSEYFYRTDTNLSASFPLKSGTSNKTISWALWFRIHNAFPSSGTFMELLGKTIYSGSARTMVLDLFNNSGNTVLDVELGKTDGTYSENILHGTTLSLDTWYHVTWTYRNSDKAYGLYLRDTSGNTLGSDLTGTAANNIGLFSNSDFMIGTVGTNGAPAGNYVDGWIDEVVVASKAFTATDATKIAKGLYSGTGDPGFATVGQMWLK